MIQKIQAETIHELFLTFGFIGETGNGGCERLAFSEAEHQARRALVDYGLRHNLHVGRDALGSVFLSTVPFDHPGIILTGSHLDTVPAGGCYDGAAGVIASLAALLALEDRSAPVSVVSWVNEEGARFVPAMMGSAYFSGILPIERALSACDADGCAVAESLQEELWKDIPLIKTFQPRCYFELHIEQGRILSAQDIPIGLVQGIQSQSAGNWIMTGRADHAGATPMKGRKDAVHASAQFITALTAMARKDENCVATVGDIHVSGGARNVIASELCGTLDIRHPDLDIVRKMRDAIIARGREIARQEECNFYWEEIWEMPGVIFDRTLARHLTEAIEANNIPLVTLTSGGGHDAVNISRICPSTMLFVSSKDGLSHNPNEFSSMADIAVGATVLAHAIARTLRASL